MGVESKHAYRFDFLKSEEWSTIRAEVLAAEKARCFICELEDASNDVHHMYYRKHWRDTSPADCHVLCRRCHESVHEYMGSDDLKGMSAFDLRKAFCVLSDVLRDRFRTDLELNRSTREPDPVAEPVKKKRPSDFLREEVARLRLELSAKYPKLPPDPIIESFAKPDPDFIGPTRPRRPSDMMREEIKKLKSQRDFFRAEVRRLQIENDELRTIYGPPREWSNWEI